MPLALVVGISDVITFFTLKFPNKIKSHTQSLLNPLLRSLHKEFCPLFMGFLKDASCWQPWNMKHKGPVISWNIPCLHNSLQASRRTHHSLQACTCFPAGKKDATWPFSTSCFQYFLYLFRISQDKRGQTSRKKGSSSIFFVISLLYGLCRNVSWLHIVVIFLLMTEKF